LACSMSLSSASVAVTPITLRSAAG
jgi:hypothetical protein